VIAICLGIAICFKVGIDVLRVAFQVDSSTFGYVVTGILVSRGSNYLHDIVEKIQGAGK